MNLIPIKRTIKLPLVNEFVILRLNPQAFPVYSKIRIPVRISAMALVDVDICAAVESQRLFHQKSLHG